MKRIAALLLCILLLVTPTRLFAEETAPGEAEPAGQTEPTEPAGQTEPTEPVGQPDAPKASDKPAETGYPVWFWPTVSTVVTSTCGYRPQFKKWHNGVDIRAAVGTDVYAAEDGVVVKRGQSKEMGKYLHVYHAQYNVLSVYEHLSRYCVSEGDRVARGQLIAKSGNTGNVPAHLHFELVRGKTRQTGPEHCLNATPFSIDGKELTAADFESAIYWEENRIQRYTTIGDYTELCERFPSRVTVEINRNGVSLWSLPSKIEAHGTAVVCEVQRGARAEAYDLYRDPNGACWYRVTVGTQTGYVFAGEAKTVAFSDEAIESGFSLRGEPPRMLAEGKSFPMELTLVSDEIEIAWVEGSIADAAGKVLYHKKSNRFAVGKNAAELQSSTVNRTLPFGKLKRGTYVLVLTVGIENRFSPDGVELETHETELRRAYAFTVGKRAEETALLRFDAAGGVCALTEGAYPIGETVALPDAERAGYAFSGWFTAPEGGEALPETIQTERGERTLYAHWTPEA